MDNKDIARTIYEASKLLREIRNVEQRLNEIELILKKAEYKIYLT
ncbi:MAG: hypothetical protein Q8920_15830 [Bacillota bacterium]|nr:hypothetical protein [Bacillota bacterium]